MEVFKSETFYSFRRGDGRVLRCRRTTGEWSVSGEASGRCVGHTPLLIGTVRHQGASYAPRLLVAREWSSAGEASPGHEVMRVRGVGVLPLNSEPEDELAECPLHPRPKGEGVGPPLVDRTWGAVKSYGNVIRNNTTRRTPQDAHDRDKLDKRITEEVRRVFEDGFFFCTTADITNPLQRLDADDAHPWKHADDRFFWNKHMLADILNLGEPDCDPWIVPVVQGYVQIRKCELDLGDHSPCPDAKEEFTLALISRRSRFRAGTRYKRRGVDEEGHVANYVETEQLLVHRSHRLSFVQVRGSAPLYWSQPGLKYRPPPKLDRGEKESQVAFDKHFDEERHIYGPICVVNLVEQNGREKVIWEAFGDRVYTYNCPDVTYATFDFHEYCRGMHFENVSVLINAITDVITDMGYCWKDPQGYICKQTGVFRVNCIDCLDRTNVVQTAIAKAVLKMQVTRLGLSAPDWPLPQNLSTTLHELWANNGDIISRQYAGTNALKGDYTRTGERKFTGIMKDGMNSANRYIIQHFYDALRQYCIDLLLGNVTCGVSDIIQEMEIFPNVKKICDITNEVVISNIVDLPPSTMVPAYFNLATRDELLALNIICGLSSYYLSRFKDAFRQATIDLLLGEVEITELLLQQDSVESEEEKHAMAEHVKQLIEDCKKLLVTDSQNVVGAWGLIDADPGTGDVYETEMDSILILTRDSYLVADYDDQSDRVTKFQQVSLCDITMIEFGIPESSSQISLTSLKSNLNIGKKAPENVPCIRIHYRIDRQDGYFHMFRSTNIRFFNNMAVYIKTSEEIFECLRSICECILVTIEVANLPKVPFKQSGKLDRRKSKPRPCTGGSGGRKTLYLELSNLPSISRNLSETQLAIKSAGSKAFTNMTEQFSKLNKLGPTFHIGKTYNKKGQKKKRTKGTNSDCTSSDNSSDDENKTNIFEPTLDNFENCQMYIGDNSSLKLTNVKSDLQNDSEAYLMENPLYSSRIDQPTSSQDIDDTDFLFDIAINNPQPTDVTNAKLNCSLPAKLNPFNADVDQPNRHDYGRSATPEITVVDSDFDPNKKVQPPSSLKLNQKLSHSTGEVDTNAYKVESKNQSLEENLSDGPPPMRSNSQQNISLTQSHSESALRQLKNITSPVASVTKDLVLSPFSKLAKGVQSFGANLDPRKIKSTGLVKHISEQQYEEHKQLQEKWRKCNTRLIAL